ncbi:MAG: MASE1 domain-containing protein, partial [Candidatus Latescibacterota bacterium]
MSNRLESRRAAVLAFFVLIAIYILVAKVGQLLVSRGVDVTVVWLPSGVALAALFLFGFRLWPGILIGSFIVYSSGILGSTSAATNPESLQSQVLLSFTDTLEALLAAFLLRRLIGFRNPCNRPQDVFKFAVLAGGVSCAIGATASVVTLGLMGDIHNDMFGTNWLYQWLAHTIGILVMTPVIINWYAGRDMIWARRRALESAIALGLLLLAGNCVFGGWLKSETSEIPLSCLAVLLLLWPALRLSQRETSTAILLLAAIAIWGSTKGYGPFADEPGHESILMLQGFVGLVAVSGL